MQVKLVQLDAAGPKQVEIVNRACVSLQEALNHEEIALRIANAHYKETRFRSADGVVASIQPEQIWGYIKSGRERGSAEDGVINVAVRLARKPDGILGSTTPGKLPWETAYWFVNTCLRNDDPISLARHFIHEWLHVAGFFHYPNNKARDDVPYNVGAIVETLLRSAGEKSSHSAIFDDCLCGQEGAQLTDRDVKNPGEGPM